MIVLSYFIDLLFLFISLHLAIFVRLNLPFGSIVFTPPNIPTNAYVLMGLVWAILFALRRAFSSRLVKASALLWIPISAFIFSLAEYFVLNVDNPSFSRLFVAVFFSTNSLGLYASRELCRFLQMRAAWFVEYGKKVAVILNSLNQRLFRFYGELIASIIVALVWVDYIVKMGLTITSDAITYLHLGMGWTSNGVPVQSTNPPLYPFMISASKSLTQFPADGAAIISVACLVLFFVIFAFLLRRFSHNSMANILAILLLASFQPFINLFLNAGTEQPYSVFLIANFFLLTIHHFNPKWVYLAGALLLSLVAVITRFIGLGIVAMLILYVIFLAENHKPITIRVRKYILPTLLVCSAFLLIIWLDPNIRDAVFVYLGRTTQRALPAFLFGKHSFPSTAIDFFTVFWKTARAPYILIVLGLLAYIFLFRKHDLDEKSRALVGFLMFFILGYTVLTILTLSLTRHLPQPRYWLPMFFLVPLGTALVIKTVIKDNPIPSAKWGSARSATLIALFTLPIFSLIIGILGVENVLVDRVRDARENPIPPAQAGFNLSPTSKKLGDFFAQISSVHDQNTIVVIEGDYNMATMVFSTDFEIAKSFLFKSSIIADPSMSEFKFTDVLSRLQNLSYRHDNRDKELQLIVPTRNNIIELIPQLEHPSENTSGPHGVFFIINEQWFSLFASEMLGEDRNKLRLFEHIEPYLIFELSQIPAPIARDSR